jgi:hypothetical protein
MIKISTQPEHTLNSVSFGSIDRRQKRYTPASQMQRIRRCSRLSWPASPTSSLQIASEIVSVSSSQPYTTPSRLVFAFAVSSCLLTHSFPFLSLPSLFPCSLDSSIDSHVIRLSTQISSRLSLPLEYHHYRNKSQWPPRLFVTSRFSHLYIKKAPSHATAGQAEQRAPVSQCKSTSICNVKLSKRKTVPMSTSSSLVVPFVLLALSCSNRDLGAPFPFTRYVH